MFSSNTPVSSLLDRDGEKTQYQVALPNFQLFGRIQLQELNEYKKLSRPIRNLLEKNFDVRKWAEMRLTPEPNTHVIASFSLDDQNKLGVGRALVFHETPNFNFTGLLSNKQEGRIGATWRGFTTRQDHYFGVVVSGKSPLSKNFYTSPNILAGVTYRKEGQNGTGFATEIAYNIPKRRVEGYSIFRASHYTVGINASTPVSSSNLDLANSKLDAIFSYSGSHTGQIDWRRPEYYDLSVRLLENGQVLKCSYYHQMKFYGLWRKSNEISNVVLGGEFVHDERKSQAENYLTVGGAWQLTRRALLKARFSTTGDVDATIGGSVALPFPHVTVSGTVRGNLFNKGAQFGISVIVEDA